jgi:hypothetical protein
MRVSLRSFCSSDALRMKTILPALTALCVLPLLADEPIDIGSRRELFVDDHLVARLEGASLQLHKPEAKDVAITCDAPWEGNTSAYVTLFQDGDRYRMYYRGSHTNEEKKSMHPEVGCYAESRDGLKWEKPQLGLHAFNGSTQNNIVWATQGGHNFTPFKDMNPKCEPDARYKAFARGSATIDGKKKSGLLALKSEDGIRWSKLREEPVITAGAFDSQNLAYWDAERREYRAYWRIFSNKVRAIRTATSKDFIHWEQQADLKYVDSPDEHLYTNAIMPYARAPHLFIGFPTRFQPSHQQVEPIFMTSRDGVLFRRWAEPLIPITAPKDRDGNRSNYMTWGLLQLPGNDREMSVYATEAYYAGPGSRVRRFAFRVDGFVSVHAPAKGALVTKPLRFAGKELELNLVSRGDGVRVELQDADGKAIKGFTLDDCVPMKGDEIKQVVKWQGGSNVNPLTGKAVKMRVELNDADVYSMKFNE